MDRVKLLALLGVSGLSLTWLLHFTYNRLKHYYEKRRMWSALENVTPKPMWILVQPFSAESLSPVRVKKINPDDMFPYDVVFDVIVSVLNIKKDELVLKQTHPGRQKQRSASLRSSISLFDKPNFGFQTSMTVDLLPDIRNLMIIELKREGIISDELLRMTKREAKFYLDHEQIYLPVLM